MVVAGVVFDASRVEKDDGVDMAASVLGLWAKPADSRSR